MTISLPIGSIGKKFLPMERRVNPLGTFLSLVQTSRKDNRRIVFDLLDGAALFHSVQGRLDKVFGIARDRVVMKTIAEQMHFLLNDIESTSDRNRRRDNGWTARRAISLLAFDQTSDESKSPNIARRGRRRQMDISLFRIQYKRNRERNRWWSDLRQKEKKGRIGQRVVDRKETNNWRKDQRLEPLLMEDQWGRRFGPHVASEGWWRWRDFDWSVPDNQREDFSSSSARSTWWWRSDERPIEMLKDLLRLVMISAWRGISSPREKEREFRRVTGSTADTAVGRERNRIVVENDQGSKEEEQRLIVSTDWWTNNSIGGEKQKINVSTVEEREERWATKQISERKKEKE
jgi:hypothetical protein